MICAWCPNFDPSDPANKEASHGMCPNCEARWNAEVAAAEAAKLKVVEAVIYEGLEDLVTALIAEEKK